MQSYNDYDNIVYGYLRNYNRFQSRIKYLEVELDCKRTELSGIGSAKTASYGAVCGGGYNELAPVERVVEKSGRIADDIEEALSDMQELNSIITKINTALACISSDTQEIITKKFFEDESWQKIARDLHYTERWSQKLMRRGIHDIARIMFGNKVQCSLNYVFVDNSKL